jgi:hypothetical protein
VSTSTLPLMSLRTSDKADPLRGTPLGL